MSQWHCIDCASGPDLCSIWSQKKKAEWNRNKIHKIRIRFLPPERRERNEIEVLRARIGALEAALQSAREVRTP